MVHRLQARHRAIESNDQQCHRGKADLSNGEDDVVGQRKHKPWVDGSERVQRHATKHDDALSKHVGMHPNTCLQQAMHERHGNRQDWTDHHQRHPPRGWVAPTAVVASLHSNSAGVQFPWVWTDAFVAELQTVDLAHEGPPQNPHHPR